MFHVEQADVIVVGGGHAGCEAAAAAARMGARVALITFARDNLGAMSCNPAIGGVGKGHLVREVDACGGIIARASDAAAIHYRMLNRSKGPAVWGPRVQADRRVFATAVQHEIDMLERVTVVVGECVALERHGSADEGVRLADGTRVSAPAVVLATGTFLGARLFRGDWRGEGGRIHERAAAPLGRQLAELHLPMGRMKTGTPPRIDGRTIDWARLGEQPSDREVWTMAQDGARRSLPQLFCAVARTNEATHAIIRENMYRSPLLAPDLTAGGPRYCPSIEDKVARFGDRDGHQIFLEPEGLDSHLIYPNGVSTSLPADAQLALVRTIDGLGDAALVEPGYAVEYDHVDPRALDAGLQSHDIHGLFLAGQINGTTGYEEAAAQGLVAGAAAAAQVLERTPMRFDRRTSYIGVLIDDLTLQGVDEPYRMLTARAEHRLRLRADNAGTRLGADAAAAGLLNEGGVARQRARDARRRELAGTLAADHEMIAAVRSSRPSDHEVDRAGLAWGEPDRAAVSEILHDEHYRPYVERSDRMALASHADDRLHFDANFGFDHVPGLSREMIDRLTAARPTTLGQAARVRGVTPAAVAALAVAIGRAA